MNVMIPRKNKYNAKRTTGSDGFTYDSKGECAYGETLLLLQRAGAIRLLLRQVPFYLPGKVKLVLDFVYVDDKGVMRFVDFKSPPTAKLAPFRAKKKMVEQVYDIEIDVVWGKR